ncbi:unnamed protein product [Sphagnum troendelagicum]|uniref:CULT domain-containing protein n=1 Tax=Sphagnum troendelagicum TaxID=128251 RepID=A0ABP0UZ77_9BRYO
MEGSQQVEDLGSLGRRNQEAIKKTPLVTAGQRLPNGVWGLLIQHGAKMQENQSLELSALPGHSGCTASMMLMTLLIDLLELIARHSDMLMMSSDGPISAYVNAHGYIHETLTLSNTYGLFEDGAAQTENSWFPGYAWVLAKCNTYQAIGVEKHMGWHFKAIDSNMHPKSFWGIRRTQLIGSHSQV